MRQPSIAIIIVLALGGTAISTAPYANDGHQLEARSFQNQGQTRPNAELDGLPQVTGHDDAAFERQRYNGNLFGPMGYYAPDGTHPASERQRHNANLFRPTGYYGPNGPHSVAHPSSPQRHVVTAGPDAAIAQAGTTRSPTATPGPPLLGRARFRGVKGP